MVDNVLFTSDMTKLLYFPIKDPRTTYTIPTGVTTIDYGAFYYCTYLTMVEIPSTVNLIGNRAFENCKNLKYIICLAETPPTLEYEYGLGYSTEVFYNISSYSTHAYIVNAPCELYVPDECVDLYQTRKNDYQGNITGISDFSIVIQDNIVYKTYNDMTAEVINYAYGPTDFIVSNTISRNGQTYTVNSIRSRAFCDYTKLESIQIPNSITTIEDSVFYYCTSLQSIQISNSITSIGSAAFCFCRSLQNIEIPNAVTSIRDRAFYYCTSLQSIKIPNGVTRIENATYYNCTNLQSIEVPSSVTSIGEYAFTHCKSLQSVGIPNSVTSIGYGTFSDCTSLQSIEIPKSVTSIGDETFAYCTSLQSITVEDENPSYLSIEGILFNKEKTSLICYPAGKEDKNYAIPNTVTSIVYKAFIYCANLQSIEIPNSVTSIGTGTFYGCTSLQSVEIPNSVTSIGYGAFYGCTSLQSVEIPNSVTSIGNLAFADCTSLQGITCNAEIPPTTGSQTFSSDTYTKAILYVKAESIETYKNSSDAWSSFTYIEEKSSKYITVDGWKYSLYDDGSVKVFYNTNYQELKHAIIPETFVYEDKAYTVTGIASKAFDNCSKLVCVEIPQTVTNIGNLSFSGCSDLLSIVYKSETPGSFTTSSFTDYSPTLYVPANAIDTYEEDPSWSAFSDIKPYEANDYIIDYENSGDFYYTLRNNNTAFVIARNDSIESVTKTSFLEKIERNSNTFFVKFINEDGFRGCTNLTSVELPDYITSIGARAFLGCTGLNTFTFPSSINTIAEETFQGCTSLQSIEIPNSVTSIGAYSFYGCTNLQSIEIPSSVTSIGNGVFSFCTGLTSFTIPSTVSTIADGLFQGCSNLTDISIPTSITKIGYGAFFDCSKLTSIDIPNSVTELDFGTFYACTKLATIKLPKTLESIGEESFRYCVALKDVVCYAEVPPTINYELSPTYETYGTGYFTDPFFETYETATLYVPAGTEETYRSTDLWGKFANIRPLGEYNRIDGISEMDEPSVTAIYTLDGKRISEESTSLKPGIYIIKQGGTTRKVIIK